MIRRPLRLPLVALALVPALLVGCSSSDKKMSPAAAASAPVPGVTLPPGGLVDLVPSPSEVPAGMVPVVLGSGPRSLDVIASYSGTGAAATAAAAALRAHGFQDAYVAQYANQTTGQVLSVVVSKFSGVDGATADFHADTSASHAPTVPAESVGDESTVTKQTITGKVSSELVLLRFRRGANTWVIAYQAAPTADPQVAVALAKQLLSRTTS